MTLTADEVIFHKICATDDIETILANLWNLGRHVADIQHAEPPEEQICQALFQYHQLHRFYGKLAHQLLRSFAMTQLMLIYIQREKSIKVQTWTT